MTDRRLLDDGTSLTAAPLTATATSIPVSDAQWTTDTANYPLDLEVGGELVTAAGVSTAGTQTFTGVTRAVNGVSKAHAAGAPVRVARPLRLSLGHAATATPAAVSAPAPTPSIPTSGLVLWVDAGVDPAATNLATGQPYVAELGSTSGADAQDPTVTTAATVDVWDPDGVDDHIDTDYTPAFTPSSGALTIVFVGVYDASDAAGTFHRLVSCESANTNGLNISHGGSGARELWVNAGGASGTAFRNYLPSDGLNLVDGARFMVAATLDSGALRIYVPGLGLSTPASIASVGTITPSSVRFFRPTIDSLANRAGTTPMQAGLVYDRALTATELGNIAAAYSLDTVTPPTVAGFRTQQDLAVPGTPDHVLTALGYTSSAKITRADLDGILDDWVASTGGTTRTVTSSAQWATAMAAAVPGDLVRVTSGFTADLDARGTRYGLTTGATMTTSPAGGLPGVPIIVTCADGVYVTGTSQASNQPVLDLTNTTHVWGVGFNVTGGQFGIRTQNWGGTEANPAYLAYCAVENCGHNGIQHQGWFQTIAASGGTAPAGSGNEWGFSQWFVCESNTVDGVGQTASNFGEGIYLGRGASPGWVSRALDCWIRGNVCSDWSADGIDVKPGTERAYIYDNDFHVGHAVSGAPLGICYVASGIDNRPAWFIGVDPQIWVWANRVHDSNLTNTDGSSVNIMGYIGLSGIRFGFNVAYSHPQSGAHATFRARIEKGTNDTDILTEYGTSPTWVINNTCWGDDSVDLAGYGSPFVGTFPAAITNAFVLRNNIVDNASPATGEVDASASDFVGTVPAIGAVGDADAGGGHGSAFDLDPASSLVGAGASIADLSLFMAVDIYGRTIDTADPSPGAFQP